ncbi:7510_t:CDS:2 [Ambispora leptoticha]|uniref:7510_t:CDS:1 n=1 Tax=Ambispora leptoticha TaxID=144679 RepID=A0A9N9N4U9_9GLOM|nr:7510_t:CDS:2 [Ambispora leptoticha]
MTTNHQNKPTEQELHNIKAALTKLWQLDHNRLEPGRDYEINLPIFHDDHHGHDGHKEHGLRLFASVDPEVFKRPTFRAFWAILDNYIPQTGIPEVVDEEELRENRTFIRESMKTAPMQYVFHYLVTRGIIKNNQDEFQKSLNKIWFDMYRREGLKADSSAFEHVFLGEIREGHALVPIRFTSQGAPKKFSTSFIGTSPEFEFALYSLLFLLEREDTEFVVHDIRVNIKVYPLKQDGVRRIGSGFPEIHGYVA